MSEDVFDDILEGEEPEAPPEEEGPVTGEDETPPPGEDEPLSIEDRLASLESQLSEKDKQIKGLTAAKQDVTNKWRESDAKFNQLHETVTTILSKREAAAQEEPPPPPEPRKIPVDIDEDGNAFITEDKLTELLGEKVKPVEEAVTSIHHQTAEQQKHQRAVKLFTDEVSRIVGEKEEYGPAFTEAQKAWTWLNERIVEGQKGGELQSGPFSTVDQALNAIDGTAIETEFAEAFPGADIDTTARMFAGGRSLRHTLNAYSSMVRPGENGGGQPAEKTLKQIAGKASTPLGLKNQKDSATQTIDTVASRSFDDLLGMSDDDASKLKSILRKAE